MFVSEVRVSVPVIPPVVERSVAVGFALSIAPVDVPVLLVVAPVADGAQLPGEATT